MGGSEIRGGVGVSCSEANGEGVFKSNEAVEVVGVDGQGDRAAEETVEQWEVDGEDGGGSVEGEVEAVDGAGFSWQWFNFHSVWQFIKINKIKNEMFL